MTSMSTKTLSPLETKSIEDQSDRKLFDSYINVTETVGTFFLGVLAISLFVALLRIWNRYEVLLAQTRKLNIN